MNDTTTATDHFAVVTRTEPAGDLRAVVCYHTAKVAQRHMERESIIRQSNVGGYIERLNDASMMLLDSHSDPTYSVKVVKCYSTSCTTFRNLVKTHR